MSALLRSTLEHLTWLVAHDSQNPPRRPEALVERLASELRSMNLEVAIEDHGGGSVSILGTRGQPRALLTAHVDTVPIAPGWTRAPFELTIEDDRAYGLGACDIKGGAAAMMAAARASNAPCALLFTTDEEAGQATCMRHFAAAAKSAGRVYDLAVVAEPTRARAVLAHRGVATGVMRFEGRAAHSSQAGAESALHALVRWANDALALATRLDHDLDAGRSEAGDMDADADADVNAPRAKGATAPSSGLRGVRFNLGRVDGGEKPNVVAARAEARFGTRPPPELSPREVLTRFAALAPRALFEVGFLGPALAPSPRAAAACARLALPTVEGVDFWTEAALLAEADVPAVVLGPGDIAQAHTPDEWVLLTELEEAARLYTVVLEGASALATPSDGTPLGGGDTPRNARGGSS